MKNISNLDTLFKVINQCDGAVELSLPEGGSVNLKSKLSQYFSMAMIRFPPQIPTRLSGRMMSRSERRVCRKYKAVIKP